jgi:hypothetical protein
LLKDKKSAYQFRDYMHSENKEKPDLMNEGFQSLGSKRERRQEEEEKEGGDDGRGDGGRRNEHLVRINSVNCVVLERDHDRYG